jgi:tetratricopeptide (TPR) repeat protein
MGRRDRACLFHFLAKASAVKLADEGLMGPSFRSISRWFHSMILAMPRIAKMLAILCLVLGSSLSSRAQSKAGGVANPSAAAEHAINLATAGRCAEAIPELKRAMRSAADSDLKKRAGLAGVRCAMTHNLPSEAVDLLQILRRDFPRDPEVLYQATHAYSDLSALASQDLLREAPFSYQVHEISAESLEMEGKWDEAAAEYRKILDSNPMLPSIHARLGRVLLSKPQPSPADIEQATKSFQEELEVDPRNAGVEYVLGQLAVDAQDPSTAIRHFSRASKLDKDFSEAYLALGTALNGTKQFPEAIAALETYEKMDPSSPNGHYQLAVAYAGVGRREDSNREAALQREMAEAMEAVKRKTAAAMEKKTSPDAQSPEPK